MTCLPKFWSLGIWPADSDGKLEKSPFSRIESVIEKAKVPLVVLPGNTKDSQTVDESAAEKFFPGDFEERPMILLSCLSDPGPLGQVKSMKWMPGRLFGGCKALVRHVKFSRSLYCLPKCLLPSQVHSTCQCVLHQNAPLDLYTVMVVKLLLLFL